MTPGEIVLIVVVAVGFLALIGAVFFRLGKRGASDAAFQQLDAMREQFARSVDRQTTQIDTRLDAMNRRVDETIRSTLDALQKSSAEVSQRLQNTTERMMAIEGTFKEKLVGVEGSVGQVQEALRSVHEVGKEIARLQETLAAPQLRGGLGEQLLDNLLGQVLPKEHYALQHPFRDGTRVDAVVRLTNGLVPIDSKFPLENFRRILDAPEEEKRAARREFARNVKAHIDSIRAKYIRTDEETFDFAIMYIPAENVYYETIIKDEESSGLTAHGGESLSHYAQRHHIIPASPNTLYAMLCTVAMGLKGLRFQEGVKEALARLQALSKELESFKADFDVVGKHIRNAATKFDEATRRLDSFSGKMDAIVQYDRPLVEEQPP